LKLTKLKKYGILAKITKFSAHQVFMVSECWWLVLHVCTKDEF